MQEGTGEIEISPVPSCIFYKIMYNSVVCHFC